MIQSTWRQRLAFVVILAALWLPQTSFAQDSDTVARVLAAVNAARVANGLPPYALNGLLSLSAQRHSQYQASIGQFTHNGPDGSLSLQRAQAVGYPAIRANENIYAGHTTPEEAVHWWLTADAAHRNNVLHTAMREIGVGAAVDGNGTIYYTMDISAQPNVLPIFINSDAYSTSDPNVILTLTNELIFSGGPGQIGAVSQVLISNSPDFGGATPQGWAQSVPWTLDASAGPGQKTVYVRFIDSAGRTADSQDSVVLDAGGGIAQPPAPQPTAVPIVPTPAPAVVQPQPAAPHPQPTLVPTQLPTATATEAPAVAQHPAAPTLDFSNSAYMRAKRGEITDPVSPQAIQTSEPSPMEQFRQVLWGALALGVLASALGGLRLITFWRAVRTHKETSTDGDR